MTLPTIDLKTASDQQIKKKVVRFYVGSSLAMLASGKGEGKT